MKLLLDQNLSHLLVARILDLYPGSTHVRDLGLARAGDEHVWEFARQNGFTIVSKDEDFHQRSFLFGGPPKVIWIRMGNCRTDEVLATLREQHPLVQAFDQDERASFLVLP